MATKKKNVKKVYNVQTGKVEDHEISINHEGDIVLTAKDGSFVKFSGELDKKGLDAALKDYKKAHEGQVSVQKVNEENEKKIASLV